MQDAFGTPRFAFVKLNTNDLDRAARFYAELLSLVPAERFESPHLTELVMREPGAQGFCLVLCRYKDERGPVQVGVLGPLGFYVDDADAVLERAVAAGATVSRPALDFSPWRAAFFLDPDGCEVELLSVLGAANPR